MTNIFRSEPSDSILEKAIEGERISPLEALELYNSADFLKGCREGWDYPVKL